MIETDARLVSGHPFAPDLLDVDAISAHLSRLDPHSSLRVVSAHVLARSPGKRLVIAYRTAAGLRSQPDLIGKAYVDRARAARLHAILTTLHTANPHLSVPRPVALIPELGLSLQQAARGRTLDRMGGGARLEAIALAARWLSALHGLTVRLERGLNLASEQRKVADWADLVGALHPASAQPAARLGARLAATGANLEPAGQVPIHKDFQYEHVMVELTRATVIDLDEVRVGDPALDVAHFCAYLNLLALRERLSPQKASLLEQTFLGAYGWPAGHDGDERLRFFRAYSCLKIAKQLVRGRGPAPVPEGAELDAQLDLILREGLCTTE